MGFAEHQEIEETLLKLYLTLSYIIIAPMCVHFHNFDTLLDHVSYCLGELLATVICTHEYQFCQDTWLDQASSSSSPKCG